MTPLELAARIAELRRQALCSDPLDDLPPEGTYLMQLALAALDQAEVWAKLAQLKS